MLKNLILEIIYIFSNYFICYIPVWPIRLVLYRLLGLKIGKGSRIMMGVQIVSPWKIKIGERTFINEKCFVDGRGGIEIGSDVSVAIYTKLITGSHVVNSEGFDYVSDSINIEDKAVLFAGCMCLGGAYIKKGAVFAAGTLIPKGQYEGMKIYKGLPAKAYRKRGDKLSYELDKWVTFFR